MSNLKRELKCLLFVLDSEKEGEINFLGQF